MGEEGEKGKALKRALNRCSLKKTPFQCERTSGFCHFWEVFGTVCRHATQRFLAKTRLKRHLPIRNSPCTTFSEH